MNQYDQFDQREQHDEQQIDFKSALLVGFIFLFIAGFPILLNTMESYVSVRRTWPISVQYLVSPTFRMMCVLIVWFGIYQRFYNDRNPPLGPTLGLLVGWKNAILGIVVGFACTLPMLALGLASPLMPANKYLVFSTIFPGFTEELVYRAIGFGLLVQIARMNLWVAAVLTSVAFGLAHINFTPDPGETIIGQLGFWIAMIALGGFMYAWIYAGARWNLWVVIALHAGMNLWWELFDLTKSPLGGWGATIARIVSVGLVVLFVFHFKVFDRPRRTMIQE